MDVPALITSIAAAVSATGSFVVSMVVLKKANHIYHATNSMKDALIQNASELGVVE